MTRLRAALRAAGGSADDLDTELADLYRLTVPTSLDRPISDDTNTELGDVVAAAAAGPEPLAVERLQGDRAVELLASLDPRTRQAVALRIGLVDDHPRSYREVGEAIGLSDETARRIVRRALKHLRRKAIARGLAA